MKNRLNLSADEIALTIAGLESLIATRGQNLTGDESTMTYDLLDYLDSVLSAIADGRDPSDIEYEVEFEEDFEDSGESATKTPPTKH
ncbi:hypothetical protein UFOVP244_87 [uncultured Caudovirales phage]|uniref:Uncharacterized protein n=1 Tax=uncultured Caudovirales phage TaxID=2100421 RepID=A0A6J7WWB4_9CAUD|nr:hypothetical protein UFOVP244_87 [uncultured Caudovirales phage]